MKSASLLYGMIFSIGSVALVTGGNAQTIAYSGPAGDNIRSTTFNIIGECKGNLMIYKKSFNDQVIACYDQEMQMTDLVPLNFLPKEVKDAGFVHLGDKVLMVYQYTRRRNTHCEAVLLDQNAELLTKPLPLSTAAFSAKSGDQKAYAVVHTDDKQKIMVIQVFRNEDSMYFRLHTFLLDTSLNLLRRDSTKIVYYQDSDQLRNFTLSGSGDLYFTMGTANYAFGDYFNRLFVFCRTARGVLNKDSIRLQGRLPLQEALLKLDEHHRKVWVTTLNYDDKQKNIDFLYTGRFSLTDLHPVSENMLLIPDSVKNHLRSKGESTRRALDNFVLTGEVIDREGNALVIAEKRYKDARNLDHYDALMLLNIDSAGNLLQAQKIQKEQTSDLTGSLSSYLMINTGGALHFLMNKSHRIFRFLNNYVYLLSDYRYDAEHQLKEMPVMRGLDNKRRWAPRYGMQVSRNAVVIPCEVGSSLIFARITY